MKQLKYIMLILLPAVLLTSCVLSHSKEAVTPERRLVSVQLSLPIRNASGVPGTDADNRITSLRTLIFHSDTKILAYNFYTADNFTQGGGKMLLEIMTGTYDFVFVGNEYNDADLTAALGAMRAGATMADFESQKFLYTSINNDLDIPMLSRVDGVELAGDFKIKTPDMDDYNIGDWQITLERMAVKLDITVSMMPEVWAAYDGTRFFVNNIPVYVYMPRETANSGTIGPDRSYSLTGNVTDQGGMKVLRLSRVILPEFIEDINVQPFGYELELTFRDGNTRRAEIQLPDGTYDLPRNSLVTVTGTVLPFEVTFNTVVKDWEQVIIDSDI